MLEIGQTVPVAEVTSLTGATVELREPKQLVHIQFRRFAGCPICDVHLHEFVRRNEELKANGIKEVVFFHSTTEELQQYESQLPFAAIPDPTKAVYAKFGIENSLFGLFDPRSVIRAPLVVYRTTLDWIASLRQMPQFLPTGGITGMPADFLVGDGGTVLACKYGQHPNDHWSVDELLEVKNVANSN